MWRIYQVTVGPLQSNSYLLATSTGSEAIIIDAGGDPHKIIGMIRPGMVVKKIIATHGHFDHVLAVDEIRETLGVEFYIHEADQAVLDLMPGSTERFLGERVNPPKPDGYLHDDDEITVEGARLSVIHTPGHTPGSVCLYTRGILFSGDTLFAGTIGRTDIPLADPVKIILSIKERLYTLPDETVVHPGHGEQTTILREKRSNPYVRP